MHTVVLVVCVQNHYINNCPCGGDAVFAWLPHMDSSADRHRSIFDLPIYQADYFQDTVQNVTNVVFIKYIPKYTKLPLVQSFCTPTGVFTIFFNIF